MKYQASLAAFELVYILSPHVRGTCTFKHMFLGFELGQSFSRQHRCIGHLRVSMIVLGTLLCLESLFDYVELVRYAYLPLYSRFASKSSLFLVGSLMCGVQRLC